MMNPMKILVVIKSHASTTVTDKVRNRLEQLDDFEEGSVQEMLNLSQQDYVKRIEELNQQLITAWENDQRVKALKIVIQVRLHGTCLRFDHTMELLNILNAFKIINFCEFCEMDYKVIWRVVTL